jgi:type II secretion system protein L
MSTLRVLLADVPALDRAVPWALFDADGTLRQFGCDGPDAWPRAESCEAVISSSRARIATVTLPPLPAARVPAAAAFAIEDQLAGPVEAAHLVAGAQDADGRVRIVVVDKALLQSIAAFPVPPEGTSRFARVVAEVDLLSKRSQWDWCIDERNPAQAFVRAPDGSAFQIAGLPDDDELPRELALLLARVPAADSEVCVHADVSSAQLARWSAGTGAAFAAAPPWCWHDASAHAFNAATDLLPQEAARRATASSPRRWLALRPAALIVALALALHVVATLAEWGWLRFDAGRDARAWSSLARSAGIAADAVPGADAARAALLRQYAELRHANGVAAPDDALPLLARAAPVLARLPLGTLKSATFADGAWTLELGPLDAAMLRQLDAGMKAAELPAVRATTSAGTRARFGAH